MPRVTPLQYLIRRTFAVKVWTYHQFLYAQLTETEQWYIHDYYHPSDNTLYDEQALAARDKVTKARPSLPQCAGRAVTKLRRTYLRWLIRRLGHLTGIPKPVSTRKRTPGKQVSVQVSAVVRPQPEFPRLAHIYIDLARQMKASGLSLEDQLAQGREADKRRGHRRRS